MLMSVVPPSYSPCPHDLDIPGSEGSISSFSAGGGCDGDSAGGVEGHRPTPRFSGEHRAGVLHEEAENVVLLGG